MEALSNTTLEKIAYLNQLKTNILIMDELWKKYIIENTRFRPHSKGAYTDEQKLRIINGEYIKSPMRYYREEILGVIACYRHIRVLLNNDAAKPFYLDVESIRKIQEKLFPPKTPHARMIRGKYRTSMVCVDGKDMLVPQLVLPKLNGLLSWFYNSNEDFFKRLAILHLQFVKIHPFHDGNGRTARAIVNLLIGQKGLPLISLNNPDYDKYSNLAKTKGRIIILRNLIAEKIENGVDEEILFFQKRIQKK